MKGGGGGGSGGGGARQQIGIGSYDGYHDNGGKIRLRTDDGPPGVRLDVQRKEI